MSEQKTPAQSTPSQDEVAQEARLIAKITQGAKANKSAVIILASIILAGYQQWTGQKAAEQANAQAHAEIKKDLDSVKDQVKEIAAKIGAEKVVAQK